jgi:hypothetical protein
MSIWELMAAPFYLKTGDSVSAKIAAYNTIGYGPDSTLGNGAIVKIVVVPNSPINL